MQGLMYASCKHETLHKCEGNINCRWWGHLDTRSYTMGVGLKLQVVGTLRHKVLHHGGGVETAGCKDT